MAIYTVLVRLFQTGVVEGWTTTMMFMSLQFSLVFIILAFISEYMGRLLEEQRGSNDYAISFERNSALMISDDRMNVTKNSSSQNQNSV